jgi:hypothetical protein
MPEWGIPEVVLHGWDVATALGRTDGLDPRLAELALAFSRAILRPEFRGTPAEGKHFGTRGPCPRVRRPTTAWRAGWAGRRTEPVLSNGHVVGPRDRPR